MTKRFLIIIGLVSIVISGCSSLEDDIVGTWETEDTNCGVYIDEEQNITFSDDNTVTGIEGFKEYKVNNEHDPAVLTLTGGYEENTNYEIQIENEVLQIVHDEKADEGFDSTLACEYEKVSN